MLATAPRTRTQRKFRLVDRREYEVPDLEECGEDAHRRIVKVMPLLTRHTNSWLESLKPRERAQHDLDDVLQIAWLTLLEKDQYYRADKGKYTTFAIMILRHILSDLRNHCHVVDSPRDTASKLNTLEERSPETLERIRQSIRDVTSLEDELLDKGEDPTADEVERKFEFLAHTKRVSSVVMRLHSQWQVLVLTWTYGLFGHRPLDVSEQAERLGISVAQVIQVRIEAEQQVAHALRADYI